ncbi:MAG: hypothetical protein O2901_00640 [Verrucomicrobia bacterium]|nr:hypothetical protein [Verrucomicrobiota bacterium]
MKKIIKSSLIVATCLIGAATFTATAQAEEGGDRPDRPDRGQRGARRGEFIKHADADGDGEVTFEEFKTAHLAGLEERFKKMDRNGDGVISPEDRPKRGEGRPDHPKPEDGDGGL